jgi:hypothetical protein
MLDFVRSFSLRFLLTAKSPVSVLGVADISAATDIDDSVVWHVITEVM